MLAFDTETELIREANLAPRLACLTYSDGQYADIVHHSNSYNAFRWLLEQETTTANAPFDLAVAWRAHPDLRDLIWDALLQGRVHDVIIRQKLMDIGAGIYRRVYRRLPGDDKATLLRYNLSDLHARYFGTHMEKDTWRLRYGELIPFPLEQWPEGAKHYALFDPTATSRIHDEQDKAAAETDKHNLWDEAAQVRANWALHMMSCWGFATDKTQVEKVIGQIDEEQPALLSRLRTKIKARDGSMQALVRDKSGKMTRNEKLAKQLMYAAVGDSGELTQTGYKKVKGGEMTKEQALHAGYIKIDEEWCKASGFPALIDYYHYRQNQLLRAKLGHILHAATYRLPVQTEFEPIMETGRTSSKENKLISNSMALQNPPRKGGLRECFIARPGWMLVACDYGQAELVSLAQVTYSAFGHSKMRDLLNAGQDIHVDFGSQIMAAQIGRVISYEDAARMKKTKGGADKRTGELIYTDLTESEKLWTTSEWDSPLVLMSDMRQMAKCFLGDTEVLTKTGWTKLVDLRGHEEVAAAQFHDGGKTTIRWEHPTRLTTRKADELVHLENESIDLWVTPDHRMAAWKNAIPEPANLRDSETGRMLPNGGRQWKKRRLVQEVCSPEELGKKRAWPSAGVCEEGDPTPLGRREWLLRLAVATQADGSYRRDSKGVYTGEIRFGFTKQRKIDRLRSLFGFAEIPYREELVGAAKVTTFYVETVAAKEIRDLLDADKTLPWWWLSESCQWRETILDEARFWDSHIPPRGRNNYVYSSSIKKNADVLHAIASVTGRKSTLHEEKCGEHWTLSIKDRANTRGGSLKTTKVPWGSDVYCLTVPSDAILVRYNGKTTITRQCADFGFPGGLGWASFQSYARKAWDVTITGEQSKQLKIRWLRHFPEMDDYFKWIGSLVNNRRNKTDIQQFMSQRWRGNCYYTQACNTLFQGLTADAAKAALWEVSMRCYAMPSSPLYGCRPVLFVHDEIILEAPEEQAAEAAKELERVMIEVYQRYTPDVKITADAHLMKRWSKDAEAVTDEWGKLIPWEPPQDEDERNESELLVAA